MSSEFDLGKTTTAELKPAEVREEPLSQQLKRASTLWTLFLISLPLDLIFFVEPFQDYSRTLGVTHFLDSPTLITFAISVALLCYLQLHFWKILREYDYITSRARKLISRFSLLVPLFIAGSILLESFVRLGSDNWIYILFVLVGVVIAIPKWKKGFEQSMQRLDSNADQEASQELKALSRAMFISLSPTISIRILCLLSALYLSSLGFSVVDFLPVFVSCLGLTLCMMPLEAQFFQSCQWCGSCTSTSHSSGALCLLCSANKAQQQKRNTESFKEMISIRLHTQRDATTKNSPSLRESRKALDYSYQVCSRPSSKTQSSDALKLHIPSCENSGLEIDFDSTRAVSQLSQP